MKWGGFIGERAGLLGWWGGNVHAAAPPLSVVIVGHRAEDPFRTLSTCSEVEMVIYDRFAPIAGLSESDACFLKRVRNSSRNRVGSTQIISAAVLVESQK